MLPGSQFSILKMLGIFGLILMLLIWVGPIAVGIGSAVKTGEWSGVLENSGGRIFTVDAQLSEETDYLLTTNEPIHQRIFHLAYSFSLIFMLFIVAYIMFKMFNWVAGKYSFSPSTDVLAIALIIGIFVLIEYIYAIKFLGVTIIPFKDGVIKFIINLPKILNNLIA